MESTATKTEGAIAGRKALMATLAHARVEEMTAGLAAMGQSLDCEDLRPVETGLVMVRGRIGGDGQAFNLGEAVVTRAAVRIASGEVGYSYLLGRDRKKARLAAICDAIWQSDAKRTGVEQHVLSPIRTRQAAEQMHKRAQTAATRVDFFTLVRGEDG